MIIGLEKSKLPKFRYKLYMDTGKEYYFGNPRKLYYIDTGNKTKRNSYYRSLKYKPVSYKLVKELIPNKIMFESRLLNGPYKNIEKNIWFLNRLWFTKKRLSV